MLGRLRSPEFPYGFVKCCGFLTDNAGFLHSFSDANGIGVSKLNCDNGRSFLFWRF